jgi:hypothetical protein
MNNSREFCDAFVDAYHDLAMDERAALYLFGKKESQKRGKVMPSLQMLSETALLRYFPSAVRELKLPSEAFQSWKHAVSTANFLKGDFGNQSSGRIDNAVQLRGEVPQALVELKAWCTGDVVKNSGRAWRDDQPSKHNIRKAFDIDWLKMEAHANSEKSPDCLRMIVTAFFTIAVDECDDVKDCSGQGGSRKELRQLMMRHLERVSHPKSYRSGVVVAPILNDFGGSSAALREAAVEKIRTNFHQMWPSLHHEIRDLGRAEAEGIPVYLDLVVSGNR